MCETNRSDTDGSQGPFSAKPIGSVRSGYSQHRDVAHTEFGWTADAARIDLLPRHRGGLGGLDGYDRIIVLFWVHRAKDWKMPKGHQKPPHVKVFATRMPVRPNPIGMSVVELHEVRADEGQLLVKGLDALDGTPVIDIKPYIPNFDSYPDAGIPDWLERHQKSHFHAGHGHTHETE